MMRILFIEEGWQGSSARAMRETLAARGDLEIADIAEDRFVPRYSHLPARIAGRLLQPLHILELEETVLRAVASFQPDVFLSYKGNYIRAELVKRIQAAGIATVNVFPDCSPHTHGRHLWAAMGTYDLVISTKPFHPASWRSIYGYSNPCTCVPHGYDPKIHLWTDPPDKPDFDVSLCGMWRPEYHRIMEGLAAELRGAAVSVAIAGPGWEAHRNRFPIHWKFFPPCTGRAYGDFLRRARIGLALVNRDLVIRGVRQPGDEDTTRTYELAAAHCFFLHQRTDFVKTVFDPENEVPLWEDPKELAELIQRWLPDEEGRRRLAFNAHQRAVPAYSLPSRAEEVVQQLHALVHSQRSRPK